MSATDQMKKLETMLERMMRSTLQMPMEFDDGFDIDGGVLVLDGGYACAWYEDGNYIASYGVDDSDPSVGLFGWYPAADFGADSDDEGVIFKGTDELEVAEAIVKFVFNQLIEDFIGAEAEARSFEE
jgi:hypothetical protein